MIHSLMLSEYLNFCFYIQYEEPDNGDAIILIFYDLPYITIYKAIPIHTYCTLPIHEVGDIICEYMF